MKERNECVCEIHIIKRKITYRKESLIESKSSKMVERDGETK